MPAFCFLYKCQTIELNIFPKNIEYCTLRLSFEQYLVKKLKNFYYFLLKLSLSWCLNAIWLVQIFIFFCEHWSKECGEIEENNKIWGTSWTRYKFKWLYHWKIWLFEKCYPLNNVLKTSEKIKLHCVFYYDIVCLVPIFSYFWQ